MAEDIHGARQRGLPESLSTHSTEPIHAFPDIHGLGRHKNAALGGELQHERTAKKARPNAARGTVDSGAWMHRRGPSGRCSSIWGAAGFWGRAGGSGTSTKPKEVGGIAVGAACRMAICCLRSAKRNRHCLATRDGGTTAVNATAWAQSSGRIGLWGCGRVWRQWGNWPASWSS